MHNFYLYVHERKLHFYSENENIYLDCIIYADRMVPKLISSTLKYFQYDTKNGLSLIDDHDTFLGSFPFLTILRTLFFHI